MRNVLASWFSHGERRRRRRQVLHYLNTSPFQMGRPKWVLPAEMPSGKASFLKLGKFYCVCSGELGQTSKAISKK